MNFSLKEGNIDQEIMFGSDIEPLTLQGCYQKIKLIIRIHFTICNNYTKISKLMLEDVFMEGKLKNLIEGKNHFAKINLESRERSKSFDFKENILNGANDGTNDKGIIMITEVED